MKKMRKFSLFIIGIVGLFTFNKSIMAAEAPNNVILNYVDSQFSMNYDFHVVGVGSFNTADYRKYIFKDSAGKNYVGFCRMPNRSSNTKGTPFRCVKLNPYDKKDETRAKFEAGVLAILQSGATLNSSGFEVGATEAALRSFELLWGGSITKNFGTGYHTQAHALMARNFAKKNENLVREVIGSNAFRSGLVTGIVDRINGFGPGNSQTAAFQKRFDELMLIGVNAAKNFKTSTSGKSSIKWNEKAFESIFKKETDEDGNKIYKKTISYTFDIKNMNTDKDYLKLKFECPDCEKYNATYSYRVVVNNKEVSTDITEDLLKYIKNGTGKITVNIDFTVSELSYACEKIDYKLIASYYSLLNSTVGYDCRYDGVMQEFYLLYTKDGNTEGTDVHSEINGKIRLCKPDCDQLEKECNEGDEESCIQWEDECSAQCNTIVGKAECTNNDTEFDIKEGYEIDSTTCEKSDKENILKCVVDKEDKAGNSYNATNLVENQYCTVSCKEDYHFTLPGQKEVNSGRYFTLQAAISGTKSCYTSKIDKDLFKEDLERYRQEVIDAYNVYAEAEAASKGETTFISYNYEGGSVSNNVVNNEDVLEKSNALSAAIKKYENTIKDFNSCSEWSEKMEYNFDPQITFDYEESYMNNLFKDTLDTIGDVEKSEINVQRCSDDTDDSYESCASGWVNDGEISKETIKQFTCSFSPQYEVPVTIECSMKDITINNVTRMKASVNASGKYITPTQFFTIFPTGGVVSKDPNAEDSNDVEGSEPIINGLPVGLGTGQGVYSYYLNVKNLGEFYDTGELGRIWGSDKSVIGAVLNDEENKCQDFGQLSYDDEIEDGRYVCSYKVNCPDCPVECEPDDCFNPDCPDNNCPVECDGCLYTNGDSNITYRPITPDVLNPNDRDLGVNWQYDDTTINTALELKAYATSKEIEEDGETIYDVDPDTGESATGDVSVKVKLDSKMIKKIQDYNRANEEKGGYASNTLECYDYKDSDGKVYKNIYCYSTFIDGLLESDVGDNIKISGNRLQGNERKNTQNNSNYWTSWDKADSSKWTVTTEYGLEYSNFKKNFGAINIGPSWK